MTKKQRADDKRADLENKVICVQWESAQDLNTLHTFQNKPTPELISEAALSQIHTKLQHADSQNPTGSSWGAHWWSWEAMRLPMLFSSNTSLKTNRILRPQGPEGASWFAGELFYSQSP